MTMITIPRWESKRTDETRMVEDRLRPHFEQVDAYRYNMASIRLRVIDRRFEGMKRDHRDTMVELELDKLPPETQGDILMLLTFAPSELTQEPVHFREFMLNSDFEEPEPTPL